MPTEKIIRQTATVDESHHNQRCDRIAAHLFPDYSRSQLQHWIREGYLLVNGETCRASTRVAMGSQIKIYAPAPESANELVAQPISIDVVYEDDHIIVIDKPAGMVVHPGAGHLSHTLLNALIYRHPELHNLPRCGIVHRLDKNTSGLLVVARTELACMRLTQQFAQHTAQRNYEGICIGTPTGGGSIDLPIGRHAIRRQQFTHRSDGKGAITHYTIRHRYRYHTHLAMKLHTGRTHQIRVHLAAIGHPLLGDLVYGRPAPIPSHASPTVRNALRTFRRQALHAVQLSLTHPFTDKTMQWQSHMPADIQHIINTIEQI